jgi:hypothetical protein
MAREAAPHRGLHLGSAHEEKERLMRVGDSDHGEMKTGDDDGLLLMNKR